VGDVSKAVRKVQKVNPVYGFFVSLLITLSVVLSIVALAISLQPEAEAEVVQPFLVVEDVYFVMSKSADDAIKDDKEITMSAFITNKGEKDAASVEVRTFAIDSDTNLGEDYNQATLGLIPKGTTGEATMTLTVPEGKTYRIELLVFESGRIVVRGSGTIKLMGSIGSAGADFQTDGDGMNSPRGPSKEDADSGSLGALEFSSEKEASGFAAVFALILIIIVIIVIVLVAARRKAESNVQTYSDPKINENYANNNGVNTNSAYPQPKPSTGQLAYEQEV
jgi:hypothetical protein